jgi:hypothetical protein
MPARLSGKAKCKWVAARGADANLATFLDRERPTTVDETSHFTQKISSSDIEVSHQTDAMLVR